jgi:hypothetical protein
VYFCVLCLIVVTLPPGKNPFAAQLNTNTTTTTTNNNNNNSNSVNFTAGTTLDQSNGAPCDLVWQQIFKNNIEQLQIKALW